MLKTLKYRGELNVDHTMIGLTSTMYFLHIAPWMATYTCHMSRWNLWFWFKNSFCLHGQPVPSYNEMNQNEIVGITKLTHMASKNLRSTNLHTTKFTNNKLTLQNFKETKNESIKFQGHFLFW